MKKLCANPDVRPEGWNTALTQPPRISESTEFKPLPAAGNPPLPNPYGDTNLTAPVMPVQQLVAEILFVRTSYVKKIIEDCSNSEETVKLLRFSCWENPQFSSTVLSELLWQVRVHYVWSRLSHEWRRPKFADVNLEGRACAGGVLLHL